MKLLLAIVAILCCGKAAAQEKFIVVTVSDTVLARADLFIYMITMEPNEDTPGMASWQRTRKSFDSLLLALKVKGFVLYRPTLADSIDFNHQPAPYYSARIISHSLDTLGILFHLIHDRQDLSGRVELAEATNDSVYRDRLFAKILRKARSEAAIIAAYSGQHVGSVMTVTENTTQESSESGWTSYPPLSNPGREFIGGWHTMIRPFTTIKIGDPLAAGCYPIGATFTVRFAVN